MTPDKLNEEHTNLVDGLNITKLDEILEKLHEKILSGWIVNDGQSHVVPSHASHDGCIDEAKKAITTAYAEAIKKSRPEKQNKYSHYSTWGDGYDTGVRDFIEDLTAQGLLPNGKDE